jgi:hypothetical protein
MEKDDPNSRKPAQRIKLFEAAPYLHFPRQVG